MDERKEPRREGDREQIIAELSEAIANKILTLNRGYTTSIARLVAAFYHSRAYKCKNIDGLGWAWTLDDGATYAIGDRDMFEVLDRVEKLLEGKRKLDFSKWDDMVVGLPYNISFVIRLPGESAPKRKKPLALVLSQILRRNRMSGRKQTPRKRRNKRQ